MYIYIYCILVPIGWGTWGFRWGTWAFGAHEMGHPGTSKMAREIGHFPGSGGHREVSQKPRENVSGSSRPSPGDLGAPREFPAVSGSAHVPAPSGFPASRWRFPASREGDFGVPF